MRATDEAPHADKAGVAFHPPLLLIPSLALGFLLRWLANVPVVSSTAAGVIGPALVALAFGVFSWAVVTMLRGGTSIPTHRPTVAIITAGPFRFSRNPIYLSMILLHIGVGIWANSLWFLVLAANAVVLLTWGVIAREERYLERKFGDEYLRYKSRVRRWL